jgi:FkbM family methyltransferase
MLKAWSVIAVLLLTIVNVQAENPQFKFEGILGNRSENINNMNGHARAFLPYNPVIVEIGAYTGTGTLDLAASYPYGTIFAFEPDPKAYAQLAQNMQSLKNVFTINLAVNTINGSAILCGNGVRASLLNLENTASGIDVPCVVLDEWCKYNGVNHIDFLRLDVGGLEWQIFQSSPNILKTVNVLLMKTHLSPSRKSIVSFPLLKSLLENQGFKLLSHWYEEGKEGEAIFVRKCMYDSIFN